MDVNGLRRGLLMMPTENVVDTSPKIAEYGKYCNRSGTGLSDDPAWCYTEFYSVKQSGVRQKINDNCSDYMHTWQYPVNADETSWDYWYGPSTYITPYNKIRFSMRIADIDNAYCYSELGQIFFAGKNTPYYGHRNISELN